MQIMFKKTRNKYLDKIYSNEVFEIPFYNNNE